MFSFDPVFFPQGKQANGGEFLKDLQSKVLVNEGEQSERGLGHSFSSGVDVIKVGKVDISEFDFQSEGDE